MKGFKPFDCSAGGILKDKTPVFGGKTPTQAAVHDDDKLPPPVSIYAARDWLDTASVAFGKTLLARLPEAGESLHGLLGLKAVSAWEIVVSVLELAGSPAAIRVSTLSANQRNIRAMLGLFDEGKLTAIGFLSSRLMRDKTTEVYTLLADGLKARGQRVAVGRNHAKIVTFDFADGRKLALETSANMRTGSTLEQWALIHHAGLHDFHAGWIDAEIAKGDFK